MVQSLQTLATSDDAELAKPAAQNTIMKIVTRIGRPQSRRNVIILIVLLFINSHVSVQSSEEIWQFVFLFFKASITEYRETTQKGYIIAKIIQISIILM